MRLSEEEAAEAIASLDSELLRIVEESAENIREYHTLQKRSGFTLDRGNGAVLRQIVRPCGCGGHLCARRQGELSQQRFDECHPGKGGGSGQNCHGDARGQDGKLPPLTIAAAKQRVLTKSIRSAARGHCRFCLRHRDGTARRCSDGAGQCVCGHCQAHGIRQRGDRHDSGAQRGAGRGG